MENNRIIKYFFKIGNKVFYITDDNNTLNEETIMTKDMKSNYFEMFNNYDDLTLEELIKFKNDFNQWHDETKETINYKKYYNHNSAVRLFFLSKSKRSIMSLETESITYKEFNFFEKCYNAGLMFFDAKYKDIKTNCYGYDFSSFYPNMLLKILLPKKQGKRYKLSHLDFNNISYGIYHVKITCDDERFKKLFSFSKHNYYTHNCLKFAYKNKDEFNINIELIIDENYNALIYNENKLINSSDVFKNWFTYLRNLKTQFPKNRLVKHLLSSLWGSLCQFNKMFFNEEEFENLDVSKLSDDEPTEYKLLERKDYYNGDNIKTSYHCIPTKQPYKNIFDDSNSDGNLARLKPFLVSFARCYIAKIIMKEKILDNVIRIHTDGIILNKEHDFTHLKYHPISELKSTGDIIFKNVNNYKKV